MTHRDAGRALARLRFIPPEHHQAAGCGGQDAALAVAARPPLASAWVPPAGTPAVSAPHVKRAHRAVFSRFALSLHAVIRQRGAASEVSA